MDIDGAITLFETCLHWLGAFAGCTTLAYSISNMLLAQKRPTGQQTGAAGKLLRTPYLVIATLLFLILGYILWKPLPILLSTPRRLFCTQVGISIFFFSLTLYIWGLRTLGGNFNASSGFGVRLVQAHQLVTAGPYAYIRHPMYLSVILAGWGGLLLYRTWSMLLFAVMMFGLIYRARAEEKALALAFGEEWDGYTRRVPGWIPHIKMIR